MVGTGGTGENSYSELSLRYVSRFSFFLGLLVYARGLAL